jgi:hypothetical protein
MLLQKLTIPKIAGTLLVLLFAVFHQGRVQSQNTILAGTNVHITPGTSVTSIQHLVVEAGGGLDVEGSLILHKNLVTQNTSTSLSTGTVKFEGNTAQSLSGQNTMGSLVVNNPTGLDLAGNTTVNTELGLQNGHIRLGSNNLTLGEGATISGTPSASAMVVATGAGELRKSYATTGSFTYPVGDHSGTAEYTPVTLTFNNGAFAAGNHAGVRLANEAYAGASGNYLNRLWNVSLNGITNPQYDAVFQYVPADVVGNESSISCVKVEPAPAAYFNQANTLQHQLTAIGLTAFGTFTGMQPMVDKLLSLNILLEGLYAGGGTMNKAKNETGPQFAGTTADKIGIELHEASDYNNIAFTDNNVDLTISGTASLSVPAAHSGSYYITILHRNSLAITSAAAVPFAGNTINYSFNLPSKAFGDNLKQMPDGEYVLYGGDTNQDGTIDQLDMIDVGSHADSFGAGYISEDINGDGIVDALDMIILDNNAAAFVTVILP